MALHSEGSSTSVIFLARGLLALADCGTHAILDAVIGPCGTSEVALSRELVDRLKRHDRIARAVVAITQPAHGSRECHPPCEVLTLVWVPQ
jgi:hypothetical protein